MIKVSVDEEALQEIYREEVRKKLEKASKDLVFWDTAELKRRTCMSWNTIQNTFFFDPRFEKFKLGGKWYFPAEQAEAFLLSWFDEQKQSGKRRNMA
ncbi:group-specific protein [Bacillus badius]|uniref:Group-specific protein n=1 Tax=Bacillus badius TaxID=1455 RepID=A0ABR5B149_BACBA|nr:group-specific protein [Bacillus badius]KIL73693.1 hypothetical protein SD78_3881 [Bacillus badius]KIL80699.1 hypothetical protein SD77_0547 [Bacillus badius]MED4715372.1 group-specific protein [Bacillus badius]GLY10367.1 hypothetical protein Bbad01_15830 [Bacillus badius]